MDEFPRVTISLREEAERVAIQVLEYIVSDLDRAIQFLNVTGLQPETIRESAKSALFLLGVLDYASKDEELLKGFYEKTGIRSASVLVAAVQLTPEPEAVAIEVSSGLKEPQLPRRRLFH